jgi:hypothetical protein
MPEGTNLSLLCHLQTSAGHHVILATAVLVVIVNANSVSSIALPLLNDNMTRMMEWYLMNGHDWGRDLYSVIICKTRGSDPALRMGRTSLALPGLIFEVAKYR